jgi:hypothetical protein
LKLVPLICASSANVFAAYGVDPLGNAPEGIAAMQQH